MHRLLFLDSLGGGELLLIMIFVLLFFGSKNIPNLARGLGRGMREFKDAMNGVQRDINESMRQTDVQQIKNTVEEAKEDIKKSLETDLPGESEDRKKE